MRGAGNTYSVALQHRAEVNVLTKRSDQRLLIPKVARPFPAKKPAVPDKINELNIFVLPFPSHTRNLRLWFRLRKKAQTNRSTHRFFAFHILKSIFKPPLTRH